MFGVSGFGVLKVAAPVALGLWTFRHVVRIIERMKVVESSAKNHAELKTQTKTGTEAKAYAGSQPKPLTRIPPVDSFLELITAFFDSLLDSTVGHAIFITVMSVAAPGMAFFAFEGLREGCRALHYAFPVLALLSQILGISVVVPLLWIPLYLLTAPITTGSILSASAVASVALGLSLGQVPTVFMISNPNSLLRTRAIQWFQISVSLAWIPFAMTPFTHAFDYTIGHLPFNLTPEAAFYFALGSALIGVHGWITSKFVFDYYATANTAASSNSLVSRLWKYRSFKANENSMEGLVCHFIFVDTVVLLASLVYAVGIKGGVEYAAYVLGMIPLVGPGAAISFAFGYLSR
ncbi:hypothetical protein BJ741DRAFT_594957 [Chytriomyces cf. hyalinus JEL632]|nr:hypothetical protein BJ741DRAFT_594957 [Chytriomyces cf. hyalinus JEL632]